MSGLSILLLATWSLNAILAFVACRRERNAGDHSHASTAFWYGVACALLALHAAIDGR